MCVTIKNRFLWLSTWRQTGDHSRSYQSFRLDLAASNEGDYCIIIDNRISTQTYWNFVAGDDDTEAVIYLKFAAPSQSQIRFYVFKEEKMNQRGEVLAEATWHTHGGNDILPTSSGNERPRTHIVCVGCDDGYSEIKFYCKNCDYLYCRNCVNIETGLCFVCTGATPDSATMLCIKPGRVPIQYGCQPKTILLRLQLRF